MLAFEFVAVLAATLFAGAAIYINVAEHPARMGCGTELAATVFGPSYRRVYSVVGDSVNLAQRIQNWAGPGEIVLSENTYAALKEPIDAEAIVGIDGSVTAAKILESIPLLDAAALDAVRQWQFTPTQMNGVAVPVIMRVTVNFNLQ